MDGLNFGMGVEPFVPIWRFTEVGGGGTERNGTERKERSVEHTSILAKAKECDLLCCKGKLKVVLE